MRPKLGDAETSPSQASWVRIQLVSPVGHQVLFFFKVPVMYIFKHKLQLA